MIIVPLYRGVDWRHPPIITIALVLINSFVFFVLQGNEQERYLNAVRYYFDSGLHKQEFPEYLKHLKNSDQPGKADIYARVIDSDKRTQLRFLMALQRDGVFIKKLQNDQIIEKNHGQYPTWKSNRKKFDKKFNTITTESYGFKPGDAKISSAFAHMFLHGGIGHLLGNMIFLFIIGFAVEAVLGKIMYLSAYITTGLFALGLFTLSSIGSIVPLIGASGAIAGLMGMYTVLFGFRRIRFFYFILFYFDFIKAPALIVLPLWILKELYQLYSGDTSNVAYMAHIGGLLGGALVGYLLYRWYPGLNTDYMDQNDQEEQNVRAYEDGIKALSELKIDKARSVFIGLLKTNPNDQKILQQLYNVEKFHPDSDTYHKVTLRILSQSASNNETIKMIRNTFHDYMKIAKPSVRLNATNYLSLAEKFIKGSYLEDAEKIIGFLIKTGRPLNGLGQTMLALANMFNKEKQTDKARSMVSLIIERFPQSAESLHAQQMLKMFSGS